jgi:hypothetical protein
MHALVGKKWSGIRTLAGLAGVAWCIAVVAATTDREDGLGGRPDGRCDRCGGCDRVGTICVKKMTEREITKVCWDFRSEQVVIPGPSMFCGTRHHHDDCGCWTCRIWRPTCAEVITRRVPVKKEVQRKVPAVEWSVEERCWDCRHDRAPAHRSAAATGAAARPAPK